MRVRESEWGGTTGHKHSVAWHGISIDIYTVSMGISTRSDSGRAPPNTADSDPARSTQTRESIVAFKLPSYSGGLSLPESRATSGRIRAYGYVRKSPRKSAACVNRLCRVRAPCPSFREKENDRAGEKGEEERIDPEARGPGRAERGPGVDPVAAQDTRSV